MELLAEAVALRQDVKDDEGSHKARGRMLPVAASLIAADVDDPRVQSASRQGDTVQEKLSSECKGRSESSSRARGEEVSSWLACPTRPSLISRLKMHQLNAGPLRFSTPAPEAAASLPTPHPQSPLADQSDNRASSQQLSAPRATSPSPEKLVRPAADSYGLPTPATPLSPAGSAAHPPLPRPPHSPNKPTRTPIPLDLLIPAGTILLRDHSIVKGAALPSAEDGWKKLAKGILERRRPTADETVVDEVVVEEAENEPTSPAKGKGKKGKRKAMGGRALPAKKRKTVDASEGLLEHVIHLQDALLLRATFIATQDQAIILRIYLVPVELPEREQVEFARGRRARPADSVVIGVLSAVRVDEDEWKGVMGQQEKPSVMEEQVGLGETNRVRRYADLGTPLLQDKRSILELYRAVSSPPMDPNFVDSLDNASPSAKDRIAAALENDPTGFLTELYPYQKVRCSLCRNSSRVLTFFLALQASLAKMLQRELAPERAIDPSFILRTTPFDSSSFYVSVRGEVRRDPPREVEPRSGILAEDMGAGKTCICLALVLSTLRELPHLEGTPTYLDGSSDSPNPVLMTHLSRNFPFDKEM